MSKYEQEAENDDTPCFFDTSLKAGIQLWEEFGDIPINDDDEIEEEFLEFEVGTDRFEIWHWFEDTFDDFACHKALNGDYENMEDE